MRSTTCRLKASPSFTVGLGILVCLAPGACDSWFGPDEGAPDGGLPAGSGGASGAGGACMYCGVGGESGSNVGGSGTSGGAGGDVSSVLPDDLAPCPALPNSPGAALLRVPAVLPEGAVSSIVNGVSADGSTVVGNYDVPVMPEQPSNGQRHFAFRWTQADGLERLDAPDNLDSYAAAANADGSVIVGSVEPPISSFAHAVVWTSSGMRQLDELPGATGSRAVAVSSDGSVITGVQELREETQARVVPVRWTAAGIETLDNPAQPYGAHVVGASADGSVVAGTRRGSTAAVRWTGTGPMEELPVSDASLSGVLFAEAAGISDDGAVVVGWASSPERTAPVRWDGLQAQLLGFADGEASLTAQAFDADADGSTIIGVSEGQAAVWDQAHGMRRLSTLLASLGEDLSSWFLGGANGVSADGRVIVGTGYCGYAQRGFAVRLPAAEAPAAADAGPAAADGDAGP